MNRFSRHTLASAAIFALALILGGCAARPTSAVLVPVTASEAYPHQITIFVATTREPDPKYCESFCSGRSKELHLARYVIGIPANHKPANIEWPRPGQKDPSASFATLSFAALSPEQFMDNLADSGNQTAPAPELEREQDQEQDQGPKAIPEASQAATPETGPAKPPVVIFVHGYNTSFPEALYRMAQLVADNPNPGHAVLFSWPSDGTLSGYVADKDAAAFSRDQLTAFLTWLTQDPRLGDINLAAHSMGCWLTMEALRQLRLSGHDHALDRLGSVILAAPDIDLDVFRSQMEVIGPLTPPLTVLASPDDRALSLSDQLGGGRERVGSLDARDPRIQALAQAEKFQLIDISSMSATDSLNHDRFVGAAATLQKVLEPKRNPLRKAGAFVLDAAASVLEVPGRIGRAAAENLQ
ncbi:MAG: alpha/beta fold hydrolase [Humidesulfovibrio sp.]|nr:alpha/beta fold hydrolase [Humidesulfovibrio sp.]